MEKKVKFTRPVLNVPISRIKELPDCTYFTLIGINTMNDRPSGEEMFMRKSIRKYNFFGFLSDSPFLKPFQFAVASDSYVRSGFFPEVITSLCISTHNF